SDSFIQSREIWQESDSAHSQFLYTLSELIKPNRYHERRELREKIQTFDEIYGDSAPFLTEFLTTFADYNSI
ncbi:MAG: hypothetical protein PHC96_08355, partial [Firmicutes bacterium]|nr:hypothetical protein [Bacillota bacterium]